MAIAHDATASATNNAGGVATVNLTIAAGSNLFLIVSVEMRNAGGAVGSVSTCKWNTTETMTLIDAYTNPGGNYRVELWGLVNPTTGAHSVSLTYTGTIGRGIAGASSYSGVNQSTPTGTAAHADGTSTAPAVTLTSAAGEVGYACCGWNGSAGGAGTSNDTQRYKTITTAGSGELGGGAQEAPGAASVTIDWTITSTIWTVTGVPIKPAGTTTNQTVTVTCTVTPTVTKQVGKVVGTVTCTATVASVVKSVGKVVTSTATCTPTVTKAVTKGAITVTVTVTPTVTKQVNKVIATVIATGTVTITSVIVVIVPVVLYAVRAPRLLLARRAPRLLAAARAVRLIVLRR